MNTGSAPNRRVLVIDDNVAIHDDFRKILSGDDGHQSDLAAARVALFDEAPEPAALAGFDVEFANQGQAGLAMVQQALAEGSPFAMAFVDMRMPPGWDGVETIEQLWQADPDLQVVICTAFSDHAWEQVIERLGQNDRLLILRKPFDTIEAWQITNALTAKWELQRQARARNDELEAEVSRRTFDLVKARDVAEEARKEFRTLNLMLQSSLENAEELTRQSEAANIHLSAEIDLRTQREAELVRIAEALQQEIVGRQLAEQQFLQSQKLEAVGRLSATVAHDFNNLLTVIISSTELLLSPYFHGNGAPAIIEDINKAAERGAALTRQLLAFSRQEIVAPIALNLNAVVANTEKMLRRVVKENIRLDLRLADALQHVRADPGQIEQVLMNLVVNASDAMPDGGQLTIETSHADLDAALLQGHPDVRPGAFVRLAVSDTGCGMDEHTRARIFEPFFTTKARGKGTGLGLATVSGIVREAGGWLDVESQPGRGSTFKVYLPQGSAGDPPPAPAPVQESAPDIPQSTETVLLVEDEENLLGMLQRSLESSGYLVLAASDGHAAIRLCEEHAGPIHILITDLVMPGMSGRQVSERVRILRSGIPVLFISGYTDDDQVRSGVRDTGQAFLQKPFAPSALARKLREVLEASPAFPAVPGTFNS